jgi:uncharacterized membrane protein
MASNIQAHLRNTFLAGAFAAIPVAGTAFVVWYIDASTRILSRKLFGADVPFLGLAIALVAIYLLGVVVTSLVGKFLLRIVDRILTRLPLLKPVYETWKQVALTPGEGIFAKVVLVPDESGRMSLVGFTSGQPTSSGGDTLAVFIPAAPNPTSGRLCLVRQAHCRFLPISNEEAFKMILSSGCYIPPGLGAAVTSSPPTAVSTRSE